MILFGSILLVLVVLGVVVYPVFRPRPAAAIVDDTASDLVARRDSLYSTLAELQMDYEMGNLSPADHQQLEEKYKEKAVVVLREMDLATEGAELDTIIEREVAKRRRAPRRQAEAEQDIEKEVQALRQARPAAARAACPKCGAKLAAEAKFCSECGTALAVACPKCGANADAQAKFCAQCGTNLKQGNK